VRENRRDNKIRTIQRHKQRWTQHTKRRQTKAQHIKLRRWATGTS